MFLEEKTGPSIHFSSLRHSRRNVSIGFAVGLFGCVATSKSVVVAVVVASATAAAEARSSQLTGNVRMQKMLANA